MTSTSERASSKTLVSPRSLALAYLVVLAGAVIAVLVPRIREPVARRVEGAFDIAEAGWIARVEEGEALLADGRYEAAAAYFVDLDERFPARHNIHALDKERERVLRGLGEAYEALGRKGRALDAYRRAVAFDPRNVENHYALAAAALRLGEGAEAERHLSLLLEIHPSHAPAVRDLIGIEYERGDYAAVRETFETYVGAFRMAEVSARVGDRVLTAQLPVDGETHRLRFGVPEDADSDVVSVASTHATVVDDVRWVGRTVAGRPGRSSGVARLSGDSQWGLPDDTPAEILMDARAPIPIDATALAQVETSYRNLLAEDRFAEVFSRLTSIGSEP